jgi:hypothetical protein
MAALLVRRRNAGTSATIQDPMWNLRGFFPSSALVDAYISTGGGVTNLVLDELDARYLEIQAGRDARIAYTAPGALPSLPPRPIWLCFECDNWSSSQRRMAYGV